MSLGWPEPTHYCSSEGQSKAPAFMVSYSKKYTVLGTRDKSEAKTYP